MMRNILSKTLLSAAVLTMLLAGSALADLTVTFQTTTTNGSTYTGGEVNISGATLFESFFKYPASTNDWIDADKDGFKGYRDTPLPQTDQLATSGASTGSITTWWLVNYRGVGSGNGLAELVDYKLLGIRPGAPGNGGSTVIPDVGYMNRFQYASGGTSTWGSNGPDNSAAPYASTSIDAAVMDVPTKWFVQAGSSTDAKWNKKPTASGYGQNAQTSWTATQSNKLKTLWRGTPSNTLNVNTSSPDSNTIFDTEVAWVPTAIIANVGVGKSEVTYTEMQYLETTGRMPNGENLVAATRDSGSGTRNATVNSFGVDPSWARGDNLGSKQTTDARGNLGANHQTTNMNGSGGMELAVQSDRLAVGYTGVYGSGRAISDAGSGLYQILGVKNNVAGGTVAVRPTPDAVLYNGATDVNGDAQTAVNAGYFIGGSETIATVGTTYSSSTPMANQNAAAYINNITQSVADFLTSGGTDNNINMPGEWLANNFPLNAAVAALPSPTDPTAFSANGSLNTNLQSYTYGKLVACPAYGAVKGNGIVPTRDASGTAYTDGSTNGSYRYKVGGVYQTDLAAGKQLSVRNKIQGDFNADGTRNAGDASELVRAVKDPMNFDTADHGGAKGDMTADVTLPVVIGDFNGDGNFDSADVRYFADGLAINTSTSKLDRGLGFTNVDNADAATGGAGNYFGTTKVTTKAYAAGDSRADVAGNTTVAPGAKPLGNDGVINEKDIWYVQKNFGDWSNLDQAVFMNLSCDMNGDLKVDQSDVNFVVQTALGTHLGDSNWDRNVNVIDLGILASNYGGSSKVWATGDFNGDGAVNVIDLGILASNYGTGPVGDIGGVVPEPATLSLLAATGFFLVRNRRN